MPRNFKELIISYLQLIFEEKPGIIHVLLRCF